MPAKAAAISLRPVVCGLVYLLAFLPFLLVLRHHFGFPLDDSWIHQVIARNLADYHVLGFNPGKATSGSSSLLWTLILTVNHLVLPQVSPVIYCASLGALLLVAIGHTLYRIGEFDGLEGTGLWAFALGPALSGNFLWFGLIGMEHLLFILLSLLLVAVWFRPVLRRKSIDRIFFFLLGLLLVLTRPEGCVLVLLLAVSAVRFAQRSLPDAATAAAGMLTGMCITCAINLAISGEIYPPTMRGRQFLFTDHPTLRGRLYFLGQVYLRLTKTWIVQPPQQSLRGPGGLLTAVAGLLLCVLLGFALRRLYRLRAWCILFLGGWAAAIVLLYFAVLPSPGHGGRYVALPMMLFFNLVFFGACELLSVLTGRRAPVHGVIAAFALLTAAISIPLWLRVTRTDIDQINSEHGAMGDWLAQNLPVSEFSGLHVAVFDIGLIGYKLDGNLIDLGGLVDAHYLPFLLQHRTAEYLSSHEIHYVVLPTGFHDTGFEGPLALDRSHGVVLTPVHTVCADPEVAAFAQSSTITAFPCQVLFSIGYDSPEALGAGRLGFMVSLGATRIPAGANAY